MHECEIIQHEVTSKQRMDKFIDIVLTKGPEAVGVFHESLRKDYPFVFDILTRLFSSASIDLPQSRQLRGEGGSVVLVVYRLLTHYLVQSTIAVFLIFSCDCTLVGYY